jgi:hypothetical protein
MDDETDDFDLLPGTNEQKTIGIVQIWSLWHPPPKQVDLLPQNQILVVSLGVV